MRKGFCLQLCKSGLAESTHAVWARSPVVKEEWDIKWAPPSDFMWMSSTYLRPVEDKQVKVILFNTSLLLGHSCNSSNLENIVTASYNDDTQQLVFADSILHEIFT